MNFRFSIVSIIFIVIFTNCLSQVKLPENSSFLNSSTSYSKPILDTSVFNNWPEVSDGAITNNGKYVLYAVREKSILSLGQKILKTTTIVQSPDGLWKRELKGVKNIKFTVDSRYAVFINADNSLCLLKLGTIENTSIPNVGFF